MPDADEFLDEYQNGGTLILGYAKVYANEDVYVYITYMSVHLEVCKVLVQGLKDLGLMKGNVEEAVAAGAHALFLPHGLAALRRRSSSSRSSTNEPSGRRRRTLPSPAPSGSFFLLLRVLLSPKGKDAPFYALHSAEELR